MIRILDEQTANKIAAGEVIERPASIVKELLENSIDAGASAISVEIEQGGIKRLLIRDNGMGMSPDDCRLAFQAHATSKISQIADLDALQTMGFRGEALASIAAVSKVNLRSRLIGEEQSYQLYLEAGQILREGFCGGAEGTEIVVEDLFYNVPARYKFLKKDSSEAAAIYDLLQKLALSRPDLSIRFLNQGKEQMYTPGNGDLRSVIHVLWGREAAEQLIPVELERQPLQLSGMVLRPSESRKNRQRQIVIVNGRLVQSQLIRQAIEEAGRTWFMKGQHACCVLQLTLPAPLLDVNVHPQKREVRFWDEQAVFKIVYHGIQEALTRGEGVTVTALLGSKREACAPDAQLSRTKVQMGTAAQQRQFALPTPKFEAAELSTGKEAQVARSERLPASEQGRYFHEHYQENLAQVWQKSENQLAEKTAGSYSCQTQDLGQGLTREALTRLEIGEPGVQDVGLASEAVQTGSADPQLGVAADIAFLQHARLIGQLFQTYLLLELSGELVLVDQHAAHERVLYEAFSSRRNDSVPAQELLTSLELRLEPLEIAALEEEKTEVKKLGFDYDLFGVDRVLLRAVPAELKSKQEAYTELFKNLAQEAQKDGVTRVDRLDHFYHTMACKAAVKGHDRLSYDEMTSLLEQLSKCKNPYHCPHGRPILIRITEVEIEKMFKRIVS